MSVNRKPNLAKRTLDLLLVVPAIILLSPVLAVIVILVRLKLGSPILFRQQRPGLRCQPFTILKFRTMRDDYDSHGKLLPDRDRQTSFGRFLRQSSLDELPELFNILKGDMSVVGPRPLLMKYLNRYDDVQILRHEVKPGLTGWAQVNGRNAISWDEKLRLDNWYVDNWSLALDLKTIMITIWKVLKREGISQPGQVGMAEFRVNGTNGAFQISEISLTVGNNPLSRGMNGSHQEWPIYTPEFKANVVVDLISGLKRVDDICREHSLDPYILARWHGEFLEKIADIYRGDGQHSWERVRAAKLEYGDVDELADTVNAANNR